LKTRFQSLRDAFGSPTPVFNESASAHEIIDKSNAFKTSIMLRVQGLSHGVGSDKSPSLFLSPPVRAAHRH